MTKEMIESVFLKKKHLNRIRDGFRSVYFRTYMVQGYYGLDGSRLVSCFYYLELLDARGAAAYN